VNVSVISFDSLPGSQNVAVSGDGLYVSRSDADVVLGHLIGRTANLTELKQLRTHAWSRGRRVLSRWLMIFAYLAFIATVLYLVLALWGVHVPALGMISVTALILALCGGVGLFLHGSLNPPGELGIQVAKLINLAARMDHDRPSLADVNDFAVISGAAAKSLFRVFTSRHVNVAVRPEILEDVTRIATGFMIAAPRHPKVPVEVEWVRADVYCRFARATLVLAVTGRLDLYPALVERAELASPVELFTDSDHVDAATRGFLRPLAQSGLFGVLSQGAIPLAAFGTSVIALIVSIVRPG
jgi:hypothetical protein